MCGGVRVFLRIPQVAASRQEQRWVCETNRFDPEVQVDKPALRIEKAFYAACQESAAQPWSTVVGSLGMLPIGAGLPGRLAVPVDRRPAIALPFVRAEPWTAPIQRLYAGHHPNRCACWPR